MAGPRGGKRPTGTEDSEVEGTGLTERDFAIPIKDSHGHSDRVSLRVHPVYMPILNGLLRSKAFPIRSTNDLVRLGIDLVCRRLEKHPEIPSLIRSVDAIRDMLAYEETNVDYLSNFESLGRVVGELNRTNAPQEAARIVATMQHHIEAMPAGYWRDRYTSELKQRYGHLLAVKEGEGADLGGAGDS